MTSEEQKTANYTLIFCVAVAVITITGLVFILYKHVVKRVFVFYDRIL